MSDTHPATASEPSKPTEPPNASFPCGTCGKVYAHSASLWKHRISKHTEGYECQLCQARIAGREELRAHLQTTHDVPKKFITCTCCGWAFVDRSVMIAHSKYLADTGEPGMYPVVAKPIYATENEPSKNTLFDTTGPLFSLTKPDDDATAALQHDASTTTGHRQAEELDQNELLSLLVDNLMANQSLVGKHEAAGVEGPAKKPKQPRKRKLLMPKGLASKAPKIEANEKENSLDDASKSLAGEFEKNVPKKNKRKAFVPVQVKPEERLNEHQREDLKERFDQARKSVYRVTQLVPTNMTPELAKVIAELVTTLH